MDDQAHGEKFDQITSAMCQSRGLRPIEHGKKKDCRLLLRGVLVLLGAFLALRGRSTRSLLAHGHQWRPGQAFGLFLRDRTSHNGWSDRSGAEHGYLRGMKDFGSTVKSPRVMMQMSAVGPS